MRKIAAVAGVTILYGLLFHGFMRASSILFGLQSSAIGSVAFSAPAAAAISTAIWMWRSRTVRAVHGWGVGGLAIALILANQLMARGVDGLLAGIRARPLQSLSTYLIVFVAVPVCVHAGLRLRRRSATTMPGDAR